MFNDQTKPKVVKLATAVALVLAVAVALYALIIAIVGMPVTVIQERVPGQGNTLRQQIQYVAVPHALMGFVGAMVVIAGLVFRRLAIAWAGLILLLAYGAFFLLSVGALILPVAILLIILLIPITVLR